MTLSRGTSLKLVEIEFTLEINFITNLKYSNIFLTAERKLALGDFGHSKFFKNKSASSGESVSKSVFGTDIYQAPELVLGAPDYSYPIDIWSFGCVIYEMATLTRLFEGTNTNQINKLIGEFNSKSVLADLKDIYGQDLKPVILNVIRG